MEVICVTMKTEGEQVYPGTQELLNYGLDNFIKVSIADDQERYEKLLSDKNYKVSDTDGSDTYIVIPKGNNFSDLDVDLDDKENLNTVTLNYFLEDHFVGKAVFPLEDISVEINPEQETVQNQVDETAKKNTDNSGIKITIFWIMICVLIAGIGVGIRIIYVTRKRKLRRSVIGRIEIKNDRIDIFCLYHRRYNNNCR